MCLTSLPIPCVRGEDVGLATFTEATYTFSYHRCFLNHPVFHNLGQFQTSLKSGPIILFTIMNKKLTFLVRKSTMQNKTFYFLPLLIEYVPLLSLQDIPCLSASSHRGVTSLRVLSAYNNYLPASQGVCCSQPLHKQNVNRCCRCYDALCLM